MKFVKNSLLSLILSLLPVFGIAVPAGAQAANDNDPPEYNLCDLPKIGNDLISYQEDRSMECDLAVNKEVSINDGPFLPADTSDDASLASLGDKVTWRITLSNESYIYLPYLDVVISDILPAGVTYVSHTSTSGIYDEAIWTVPTADMEEGYVSNLPAVLTIDSTATEIGTWQNNAVLESVICIEDGEYIITCDYEDDDPSNDSNDAYVLIVESSTPQVLGGSTAVLGDSDTLSDTGVSSIGTTFVGLMIIALVALSFRKLNE